MATSPLAQWVTSCLSVFEVGRIYIFKINRCLTNTRAGGLEISVSPNSSPASDQMLEEKASGKHTLGTGTYISYVYSTALQQRAFMRAGGLGEGELRIPSQSIVYQSPYKGGAIEGRGEVPGG